MAQLRRVSQDFFVETTPIGTNMNVCRSVGCSRARALPPFVGCEQFWVDTTGNPPSPLRGTQKLTLLLSGKLKMEFSPQNLDVLEPGDCVSVMNGKGARSSMLSLNGLSIGINISFDVPEKFKRETPSSDMVQKASSIMIAPSDNVEVQLISGSAFGQTSLHPLTLTPTNIMFVKVAHGGVFEFEVPESWNAFMYTTEGECLVNRSLSAGPHHYVEFASRPDDPTRGGGTAVRVEVPSQDSESAVFIFCCAEALDQPIYHQGPFVDVSSDWIYQAFEDYNNKQNGFEQHQRWNDHSS